MKKIFNLFSFFNLFSLLILMILISGCFRTTLVVVKGNAACMYPVVRGKATVIEKTTYLEDGKYADVTTTITIKGDNIEVTEELTSKQGDIPPEN